MGVPNTAIGTPGDPSASVSVPPPATSVVVHAPTTSRPTPITQIPFPHSPSPIPPLPHQQPLHQSPAADQDEALGIPRYHKLSFPTFDGKEDPLGWLNRCEHFFRAQHTRESDKVWLASFHMTSIAQHWFYMLERDMGGIHAITWTQVCTLCQQRFGPPLGTNHLADLARLQYNGTVPKYQEAFQARMAHAGYLSQAQQVQLFTGGLPDSIRIDVELQSPEDLQRAMYLARAYERRTVMHTTPTATRPSRFPPQPASQSPVAPSVSPATTPTTTTTQAPPRPFKTLSPSEMAERRRQGLCYNCDEQYVKGHKCPRLFYLEVSDFDDQVPETKGSESNPGDLPPLITLHAITGIRSADTMQVKVGIGNHQFTALLDSGSTRNFISESAAQHVKLCLTASQGATVIVAYGDRVACSGLAQEIDIRIGAEYFTVDCYTIPLSCYDMVLGVSYLRTLGPILWDFDDLCMAFWHHGKRVLWKGLGSTRWDIESTCRLHSINNGDRPLLDNLLSSFADVFAEPSRLPPSRPCDHSIQLLPTATPVAVRPYNYHQIQKEKLEPQCATMIKQGVIQPSTSPFSAPVFLVQIQDNTCTSYKALKDQTVKDKLPIPIMEELFVLNTEGFSWTAVATKALNSFTKVLSSWHILVKWTGLSSEAAT